MRNNNKIVKKFWISFLLWWYKIYNSKRKGKVDQKVTRVGKEIIFGDQVDVWQKGERIANLKKRADFLYFKVKFDNHQYAAIYKPKDNIK